MKGKLLYQIRDQSSGIVDESARPIMFKGFGVPINQAGIAIVELRTAGRIDGNEAPLQYQQTNETAQSDLRRGLILSVSAEAPGSHPNTPTPNPGITPRKSSR